MKEHEPRVFNPNLKNQIEEIKLDPVSLDSLVRIFDGQDFKDRVKRSLNTSFNSDSYSGFDVGHCIYDNSFVVGNVFNFGEVGEGMYQKALESVSYKLRDNMNLTEIILSSNSDRIMPLVSYKQRPFLSSCKPTNDDLYHLFEQREECFFADDYETRINCNPILAIGALNLATRNMDVLLLQQTTQYPLLNDCVEDMDFSVPKTKNFSQVNSIVRDYFDSQEGIQAELLTYKNENNQLKLNEQDINKLERFQFTPTYIGLRKRYDAFLQNEEFIKNDVFDFIVNTYGTKEDRDFMTALKTVAKKGEYNNGGYKNG